MDRRKRLFLNAGESATDDALTAVADKNNVRIFAKVRVASILDIKGSGLPDVEYTYALKAEFDFVVAGRTDQMPLFAVEFDEPHHLTNPDAIQRDSYKNNICDRLGFPLLRIDAEYLKTYRKWTVLGWLIELFFTYEAFNEAQERGEIPPDEPFTYFSFFEPQPDGSHLALSLDSPARSRMLKAAKDGLARDFSPETVSAPWPKGKEHRGFTESYCLFELIENQFIIGYARLRDFGRFGGVGAWELACDLAVADAGERLLAFRKGQYTPATSSDLKELRSKTKGWIRQGMMCSDMPYAAA